MKIISSLFLLKKINRLLFRKCLVKKAPWAEVILKQKNIHIPSIGVMFGWGKFIKINNFGKTIINRSGVAGAVQ